MRGKHRRAFGRIGRQEGLRHLGGIGRLLLLLGGEWWGASSTSGQNCASSGHTHHKGNSHANQQALRPLAQRATWGTEGRLRCRALVPHMIMLLSGNERLATATRLRFALPLLVGVLLKPRAVG